MTTDRYLSYVLYTDSFYSFTYSSLYIFIFIPNIFQYHFSGIFCCKCIYNHIPINYFVPVGTQQSPVTCSSVWVVLLYDFTLLRIEMLLPHEHVVTGNVNNILSIMWIFGNISLLEFCNAMIKEFGLSSFCFQNV